MVAIGLPSFRTSESESSVAVVFGLGSRPRTCSTSAMLESCSSSWDRDSRPDGERVRVFDWWKKHAKPPHTPPPKPAPVTRLAAEGEEATAHLPGADESTQAHPAPSYGETTAHLDP